MAAAINYCPPCPKEPILRRCRVPDLWGRISLDWNSNPLPLPRARVHSRLVGEDSKIVLKPCSVRIERCNVSSSSLVWGVEKVKLEDQTVQLLYHSVRVREGDCDEGMVMVDGSSQKENDDDMHEETRYLEQKCPKCGQKFNDKRTMVCHVVSHFYELFSKVLPGSKPFPCPICDKTHNNRSSLTRHYAITHGKILEMTDLTPEALPGIGLGKGARCSKSKFSKKISINNNCLEKKKKRKDKVMDHGLDVKSEKDDDQAELSETEDQISCVECPKCGKYVKTIPRNMFKLRFHMLTHYYQVFFDVLPDKKPFKCPLCEQSFRDRVSLARHYAFSHGKIFELTDLTPEDLLYSERRLKDLQQQKSKSDEKLKLLLLAPPLTEVSHNVPDAESAENIAEVGEYKMEDTGQTTTLHYSVPGEQETNLDITFAVEDMDDDDEFGDISAPFWS